MGERDVRPFVVLMAFLLPCFHHVVTDQPTEPHSKEYRCRMWNRYNVIRIWCTGYDDPVKYTEFVTRHGLTNAPDRGYLNDVFPDILAAGFPHVVGRNMLVKQTFESGVTVTVFDSRPAITPDVHPRQHLPPEWHKECTCQLSQTPEELVVECTGEGTVLTSISYAVNGEATRLELRRPIRIRIPMNHPSLHPGHNTISVALTDSEVLTGVLTFPVVLPESVFCNAEYCDEDSSVSVLCSGVDSNIEITCYYDNDPEPSHPCGATFAVDMTQYLVGEHSLVVVVYNPLTDFRERFYFTFIGLLEEGFRLCFTENTPRVSGGDLYAEFSANRRGLDFICHLEGHRIDQDLPPHEENCTKAGSEAGSEGRFEKQGLVPGDYTLRVVTSDPETEREEELVGRFHVSSRLHSHSFCSVHLINCGARLERGTLTVEFAGTGLASKECAKFDCCLNENCEECSSPFETELHPGQNDVKITPLGCGEHFMVWEKTFTIDDY